MKKAIFAGSFDPLHQGHIDLIKKSLKLFDTLIIIVSFNNEKKEQTKIENRFLFVKKKLKKFKNVEVIMNKKDMIAKIAKKMKINWLIRSGRNNIDFKYELELAAGSNYLNKNLETILIVPSYKNINFHSRLLKQKSKKC